MHPRARTRLYAALLPLCAALTPLHAYYGQPYYFVGPTDSLFSDPNNWSTTPNGPGGTPPGDAERAFVSPSGPFTVNLDASTVDNSNNPYLTLHSASFTGASADQPLIVHSTATMDADSFSFGPNTTLNQTTGTLHAGYGLTIAGPNITLNLNGSLRSTQRLDILGGVTLNVTGSLSAGDDLRIGGDLPVTVNLLSGSIGGDGTHFEGAAPITVNQSGGQVGGYTFVYVGPTTSYTLTAGSISSSQTLIFNGPMTQSGGSITNGSAASYFSSPSYQMIGGTISSPFSPINLAGTFTQSAGSIRNDTGVIYVNGLYAPSANASLTAAQLILGNTSPATLSQSGGSLSTTTLTLAPSPTSAASYSLSNTASLSATTAIIADQGTATFSQSGGTASFSSFTLANTIASSATLNLSNGTFGITNDTYSPNNYIAYAGTATVTQSGGTLTLGNNIDNLTLASQPGSSATYNLSDGTLSSPNGLGIGDQGAATFNQTGGSLRTYNARLSGTYNQSAGQASMAALTLKNSAFPARYNLSGGSLNGNHIFLQSGTFSQTGGTLGLTDDLSVDSPDGQGLYTISDGSYRADYLQAGYAAYGTILQTGGSVYVPYGVELGFLTGSHGYYTLAGGTLSTGYENALNVGYYSVSGSFTFNGTGTFTQTGGSLLLQGSYRTGILVSNGSYLLSAGSIAPADPLYDTPAIILSSPTQADFLQTGGTLSSINSLTLATTPNSTATYSLSGPSSQISTAHLTLAQAGNASFSQSGGTLVITPPTYDTTPAFVLASLPSATASYSLSAGSLSATTAIIADQGNANFTQSGGSATFHSFTFANAAGSTATCNLSAGTLTATGPNGTPSYIAYAGSATVNQSGGTLDLSYAPLTLAAQPGSSATYNLSGGLLATATLRNNGTFSMTGGSAFPSTLILGPNATFAQSAGYTRSYNVLVDAPNATLAIAGTATLSTGALSVGTTTDGTFTQTGGKTSADGQLLFGGAGSVLVQLAGGELGGDSTIISSDVSATFLQTGGSHGSQYAVGIGTNTLYALSAGTLSTAGTLSIGSPAGTHTTLQQTGGLVRAHDSLGASLLLNGSSPANATYLLSGGSLSADKSTLASTQSAYLLQTGGSFVTTSLTIAAQPGASGTYDLLAGSLSADTLTNHGTLYATPAASLSLHTLTNTGSLTLDGSQSWPAGSTLTNTLVTYLHSDPTPTGTPTLHLSSVSPAWAPVVFDAPTLHLASLTLTATTHATLAPTSQYLSTPALTIADTAQLDLTTSTLLTTIDPATLRQYLFNHRLFSSSSDPTHRLAYAPLDSRDPTGPWSISLALTGDANLDGTLNPDDYALLDRGFAQATPNPLWTDGDFNYDGIINHQDYLLIDQSLYSQVQRFSPGFLAQRESQFGPAYVSTLLASLPEPTSLPAVCGLATSLLPRRLRRS